MCLGRDSMAVQVFSIRERKISSTALGNVAARCLVDERGHELHPANATDMLGDDWYRPLTDRYVNVPAVIYLSLRS